MKVRIADGKPALDVSPPDDGAEGGGPEGGGESRKVPEGVG